MTSRVQNLDWKYKNSKKWYSIRGQPQEGAHGIYFKISKSKGIKIIVNKKWNVFENFSTIEELKKSDLWLVARKEFLALKKAEKSKLAPRVYKMVIAQNDLGWFYPGIIMQHIEGVLLYKAAILNKLSEFVDKTGRILLKNQKNKKKINWQEFLSQKLLDQGIEHLDLNESNVLVTKNNKLKVIDFGLSTELFVDKLWD